VPVGFIATRFFIECEGFGCLGIGPVLLLGGFLGCIVGGVIGIVLGDSAAVAAQYSTSETRESHPVAGVILFLIALACVLWMTARLTLRG